jgi:signal peptidase I
VSAPGRERDAVAPGGAVASGLRGVVVLIREVALVLVIALGLSLLMKTFLVQAFYIPSESMENTLQVGDRVLVSKLTPGPVDLRRGDVVVFADPGDWLTPPLEVQQNPVARGLRSALTFVGLLPADSGEHLIKRVVGLPGDTVVCCDQRRRITVNGAPLTEPYLFPANDPSEVEFTVTVPEGRVWVMGDHRAVSQDSRYHQDEDGGMVPVDSVVGRAFVVVWPPGRWEVLRNPSAVFSGVAG